MTLRLNEDGKVRVSVALPLPLDVVGTLTSALGALYPDSVIDTTKDYRLDVLIDPAQRTDVTSEQLAELKQRAEATEAWVYSFKDGTLSMQTPEALSIELSILVHALFEASEGANNYLEWTVRPRDEDSDDPPLVITACRSKEQTPGILRAKLRERIQALIDSTEPLTKLDLLAALEET